MLTPSHLHQSASDNAGRLKGVELQVLWCALQIAAVTTIGLVEGSSHVNWRKLMTHVTWWFFGFFCVLLATAALAAQG